MIIFKNSISIFLFIEFIFDENSTNKNLINLNKSSNYLKINVYVNGKEIILETQKILKNIFEKLNIKQKKIDLNNIDSKIFENEYKKIIKRFLKNDSLIENFYKNLTIKKDLIDNFKEEISNLQLDFIKNEGKVLNFFLNDFGLKIESEKFIKKYIKNKIKNFYISKIYEKYNIINYIDNNLYEYYFQTFLKSKINEKNSKNFKCNNLINSNKKQDCNFIFNLNESIFLINEDCYYDKRTVDNIKNLINEKSSFYLFNVENLFKIFILNENIKIKENENIIFKNKNLNKINLIIFSTNDSNNKIINNMFKEKYIFNEVILYIIDLKKESEININNFKNIFTSNKVKINKNNFTFDFNYFISNVKNINI